MVVKGNVRSMENLMRARGQMARGQRSGGKGDQGIDGPGEDGAGIKATLRKNLASTSRSCGCCVDAWRIRTSRLFGRQISKAG